MESFHTRSLIDLEELILRCRSEMASKYIQEAIICYKSGAYRSAIVSTWIAVVFDIVEKIKELALSGDAEATTLHTEFERLRSTGDIPNSLRFERELLINARDKLQLISQVEYIDLARLQEDRNRCAHPSMTADGDIYYPSAESARAHIRCTVEHLLMHPPAQGMYALDRLKSEIDSEYFPAENDKAVIALQNSPLNKARASLVRNFHIVILKELLQHDLDYKRKNRYFSALAAIETLHRNIYSQTLTEKLSELVRNLPDARLGNAVRIVVKFEKYWEFLELDVQQKLELYMKTMPKSEVAFLNELIDIPFFATAAEERIASLTRNDFHEFYFTVLHPKLANRLIDVYLQSNSFEQANDSAAYISFHLATFNANQLSELIKGMGENSQVRGSFEVESVVRSILQEHRHKVSDLEDQLRSAGFSRFLPE